MSGSKRMNCAMVVLSVLLHVSAIAWLSVPEPGAREPQEVGVMLAVTAPPPPPKPEREATPPVHDPMNEATGVTSGPKVAADALIPSMDAIPLHEVIEPRITSAPPSESSARVVPVELAPDPRAALAYEEKLIAWLDDHKHYPKLAVRRGIEGECIVRIVLNRQGDVLASSIDAGSGNGILDKEALAMVGRAAPFPMPPPEVTGARLEYLVPVVFNLQ